MKKVILLLILIVGFTSCKEDLTTISGEFSYYEDAAVLQVGNSTIYGVVLNEKMHELHNMGKQYRKEPTDGILVEIRGKIISKPEGEEGWPNSIEIEEIISVKKPTVKSDVIKIGK